MALLSGFLQRRRFRVVAPYLTGDVLDLGCGEARILPYLKPGQLYVGVDRYADLIHRLQEIHADHEFYRRDFDGGELSFPRQFDTVLMLAVIEHLTYPERVLAQIPNQLKPGGRLLITTPSPLGDKVHRFGARLGLFSLAAARDHMCIYTKPVLQRRLEQAGLRLTTYHPFLLGGNQLFVCAARGAA
jgi:SAM-dependent methyltransferase